METNLQRLIADVNRALDALENEVGDQPELFWSGVTFDLAAARLLSMESDYDRNPEAP